MDWAELKLSKRESLGIDQTSVLRVTGKVQVTAGRDDEVPPLAAVFTFFEDRASPEKNRSRTASALLSWHESTRTLNGRYVRRVSLGVLEPKMKVVKAKAIESPPKDR